MIVLGKAISKMKYRRENLDDQARRLIGMSSVKVYEVRKHENEKYWYFAIVWRGRELTTVCLPWYVNCGKLEFVGQNIRRGLDKEEEEKMFNSEQKLIDEDEKQNAEVQKEQISDAMTLLKIKNGSTVSMAHRR